MAYKVESRGQVKDVKTKHQEQGEKKEKELTNTREDKETAAATAEQLNQAGTKEGRENVKKAMEQVGQKIDTHSEKRSTEAKGITKEESEASDTLGKTKEQTTEDKKKASDAKGKMKEKESGAAEELEKAARAAEEEAKFLADFEKEEKQLAEKLEKHRQSEIDRTKSRKVTTKR